MHYTESKDFLGTEPVKKLLPRLAVPTITAQLVNMLYNIVDRIYIGHIPETGSLAITGVGICAPIVMIIGAFAALAAAGGAPRASIAMGEGDYSKAEKIMGSCFVLMTVLAVILTAVLLIWNRSFLYLFGASENTIDYALTYMTIYACGTIFVLITLGMNAFVTAQGFAKVSMLTTVIGAGINLALDPIMIFALNMGVAGAAAATVISQAVSCIWVMRFLTGKNSTIRIRRDTLSLNGKIILPCLALGSAPFIMQSSESLLNICFNTSLLKYGGDMAVGAMTIYASVMLLLVLPVHGIAGGAQPITSYNFGAGSAARVSESVSLLIKSSMIYTTAFWALVMIFPRIFIMMFTSDPGLIEAAEAGIRIYFGVAFIHGLQISCQMTFIAIGYAKSSMIVAIVRKFVLLIPAIYILPLIFGKTTDSVLLAEPVSDIIAISFTAVMFIINFRKALISMNEKQNTVKNASC